MSLAFEITAEDVGNVLLQNGAVDAFRNGRSYEELAERLLEEIDIEVVEKAALYGDTLDEQTNYAYEAIRLELASLGAIDIGVAGLRQASRSQAAASGPVERGG